MRHPSLIALSHDHHHGLALALRCRKQALGQIQPMGGAGLRTRAEEVLAFYSRNLRAHFRAEEEVLFPLIRLIAAQSESMINDLTREHKEIHLRIAQLPAAAGLAKLIFDLGDLLERHIRREERELFPLYEQNVAASQAQTVDEQLKRILESKIES